MITYMYYCKDCDIDFEHISHNKDSTSTKLVRCVGCRGYNLELIVSHNIFILKQKDNKEDV